MNIQPLNKNVHVKIEQQDNVTSAGLYLGIKKSEIETGIVISSATSDLIKVGDKIIFNKQAGTKVDDSYLIIREEFILGIINDKD